MLSIAHRFLFVHIPKTAGNTVHRVLLPYSEDEMVRLGAHQDGINRFEVRSPHLEMHKHLPLAQYRARLPRETFAEVFRFHGIRNPWDRCVSFFFSPHRGPVTWSAEAFEDFINSDEVRPAHEFLELKKGEANPFRHAHAAIRYEHLEEDFVRVCQQIGIPAPDSLPRVNASTRGDYRQYYPTDRLIDCVARKFAPEIRHFGYRFDASHD